MCVFNCDNYLPVKGLCGFSGL